jgi:Arc/MetJ-type ribon-helix-helix transcriptional regulator
MEKENKKILKTIRFSQEEVEKVESFITSNSYLDFSTVIRMAVNYFLKDSVIKLDNKNKMEDQRGSQSIQ